MATAIQKTEMPACANATRMTVPRCERLVRAKNEITSVNAAPTAVTSDSA